VLNPNDILAAFVEKLKAIPELVLELDGDPDNIVGWYDRASGMRLPDGTAPSNLLGAIIAMPKPGVLVVWNGSGPRTVRDLGQIWEHNYRLFLRVKQEYSGDSPRGYGTLFQIIVNGIPQGGTERLIYIRLHPSCDAMNVPSAQRSQIVIDVAGNTIDFFELPVTIPEIGDNV